VFFLVILSIQCKIRRDRPAELWRSTGRSRSTGWPPLYYGIHSIYRFYWNKSWWCLLRRWNPYSRRS